MLRIWSSNCKEKFRNFTLDLAQNGTFARLADHLTYMVAKAYAAAMTANAHTLVNDSTCDAASRTLPLHFSCPHARCQICVPIPFRLHFEPFRRNPLKQTN